MLYERGYMMLRTIAEKCTDTLIRHDAIKETQRPVFRYGFELFWSTFFGITSICILGAAGGYLQLAVTFLLYFMPIRMIIGGYHAKTYGRCFLLTNFIALTCVIITGIIVRWRVLEISLWILYGLAIGYIWKFSPVKSRKNPQREETLLKKKRMGHKITCLEIISIVMLYRMNYISISYMAMATSSVVAVMMVVARREGEE